MYFKIVYGVNQSDLSKNMNNFFFRFQESDLLTCSDSQLLQTGLLNLTRRNFPNSTAIWIPSRTAYTAYQHGTCHRQAI